MLKGDEVTKLYPNVVSGGCNEEGINEAFDKDGNAVDVDWNLVDSEYDANQYQRDRAVSFPTWQEQMDMQYHDQLDGTTTWKDAVAKVKADNPKPE